MDFIKKYQQLKLILKTEWKESLSKSIISPLLMMLIIAYMLFVLVYSGSTSHGSHPGYARTVVGRGAIAIVLCVILMFRNIRKKP
jgi:hypothetical protein